MPILQPRPGAEEKPSRIISALGRDRTIANPYAIVWARLKLWAVDRPQQAVLYNTEADGLPLTDAEKASVKSTLAANGVDTEGW